MNVNKILLKETVISTHYLEEYNDIEFDCSNEYESKALSTIYVNILQTFAIQ